MMTELMISIGTLAIILIGVAIMLQLISVEDAFGFIGRVVAVSVIALVALCILKVLWVGLLIPWLSTTFKFLMTLAAWCVTAIVAVILVSSVGRVVLRRFGRHLSLRSDPLKGDAYEIHDSKEKENN